MFDRLSEEQRKVLEKSGHFVVRACPGSGKTYTFAAYLTQLLNRWSSAHSGLAALSFTNVAWKEIEKQCKDKFKIEQGIKYPHYIGTIDSFINKYIFLPFGHLVMECLERPNIVGMPYSSWTAKSDIKKHFVDFYRNENGSVMKMPGFDFGYPAGQYKIKQIKQAKLKLLKKGYATQLDANHIAYNVLEVYPLIAKALSTRFPAIIIDEAQDTSAIQMKILDKLIDAGLDTVMLMGDPDQAIFEWNTADPKLFSEKQSKWDENSVYLFENRRSSQEICNSSYRLSSLKEPARAVTPEVVNYGLPPLIEGYNKDDFTLNMIKTKVKDFLNECRARDISICPENVAVLFRSNESADLLLGNDIQGFKPLPEQVKKGDFHTAGFMRAKHLFDNGIFLEAYQEVSKARFKHDKQTPTCRQQDLKAYRSEVGELAFRKSSFQLLSELPIASDDTVLEYWVEKAKTTFEKFTLNINQPYGNRKKLTFSQAFSLESTQSSVLPYRVGTIHSVKGETFDAVLLILKRSGGSGKHYKSMLDDNTINTNLMQFEEMRIVYVGITRPRKLLMLAVPEKHKSAWENILLST